MRWDDMSKNHMSWPSVAEVKDYRKTVRHPPRTATRLPCPTLAAPTPSTLTRASPPLLSWPHPPAMCHDSLLPQYRTQGLTPPSPYTPLARCTRR
jgi:hypothetical protein